MAKKARNKKRRYSQRTTSLILIAAVGILTVGIFFAMNIFGKYETPKDWNTFSNRTIPFVFDYPNSLVAESRTNTIKATSEAFSPRSDYNQTDITLRKNNNAEKLITISYRDGDDGIAAHENECFQYRGGEHINVSNDITSKESIQICGERKRWEHNYEKGGRVVVLSTSEIDISLFKQIVASLRPVKK